MLGLNTILEILSQRINTWIFWNSVVSGIRAGTGSFQEDWMYLFWSNVTLNYSLLQLICLLDIYNGEMTRFMPAVLYHQDRIWSKQTFWLEVWHKKVHVSVLLILAEHHWPYRDIDFFFWKLTTEASEIGNQTKSLNMVNLLPVECRHKEKRTSFKFLKEVLVPPGTWSIVPKPKVNALWSHILLNDTWCSLI